MISKRTLSSTGQAELGSKILLYSATMVCVGLLKIDNWVQAQPGAGAEPNNCLQGLPASFEIAETDLLEHILSRLRTLQGSEKFEEIKTRYPPPGRAVAD